MKKINLIFCLVLTATMMLFYACGSGDTTALPETVSYILLSDDGNGVIFTNRAVDSAVPAQFKLYDNDLRAIMNGETFPNSQGSSTYHLDRVMFMLAIFGLDYHGKTISQITCGKNEPPLFGAPDLRLAFGRYEINGVAMSDPNGIKWQDLIDVQGAPIIEKRVIPCTGDGRNFEVTLFEDQGISDDEFTLYFDFKGERLFRGKLVVTETGKKPSTDGVVLLFQ
jgi:hypothetical protein